VVKKALNRTLRELPADPMASLANKLINQA
jgi:hypothetical protein